MFKKVVATALAAVMTLGAFIGVNPSVAKADLAATVGLHIGGDAITTVTVTGDGQYTLSYSGDAVSAGEWGTMYFKQSTTDSFAGKGVKIVSIKLNGESYNVPSAWTTFNAKGVTADNIIDCSFYNQWAADLATMNIGDTTGKDLATLEVTSAEVVFEIGDAATEDAGATTPSEYKAQMGAQFDTTVNATVGEWPDLSGGAVKVELGKEATLTYTFDSEVKFAGNYVGVDTNFPYAADAVAKFVSVKVDGKDVTVGDAFLSAEGIDGGLRLTLTNLWNGDITTQPMDAASVPAFKTIEIKFIVESLGSGDAGTDDEAGSSVAFDPAGKYNAYFGLQSPSWTYRDPWNADNGIGSDNWGQWVINNDDGKTYGVVTDAEVAGNGTYTVSLKDFGDVFVNEFANNADGLDKFRILMITTNIPKSDDVKITNVKLILDGKTIKTYKEAFLDPDDKEYCKIMLQNEWNPDLKETLPFYNAPSKSIELKFTIEGFNYDNENAQEQQPTKAPANPSNDNNGGGLDPVVIVVIVVAVVAIVAGAVVVLGKKNKKN